MYNYFVCRQVSYSQTLEREMHNLKQEIGGLTRLKEKSMRLLIANGVSKEAINRVASGLDWWTRQPEETELKLSISHMDATNWLLPSCSRANAERLLQGKRDGTFLIRPSRTGQSALSIVCNGAVNHCIIFRNSKGFGFAEPYIIYSDLNALVKHYSQNSLEEHNDSLTTTLAYPVFGENDKND